MKKIGLMGGTFDPIHFGHLILAEQARDGAGLDKVIFMPAKMSPYKTEQECVSEQHRYNMTSLAIRGNPGFTVSDMELCGPEISYTIHTLEALQQQFGREYQLHFICGTDAFLGMEGWRNVEGILRNFPIIVGSRPRYKDRARDDMIRHFIAKYGARIQKVHMPKIDISSSDIKKRIKEKSSIRYLLPESVINYIESNELYQNL
ncbi:MAG: nicotinate-nucleotide adenylyltransferase [Clostridiales bacterium]|nr:nicotinate-nucleotide adenylyltransferase [Clostridiales bacterium]